MLLVTFENSEQMCVQTWLYIQEKKKKQSGRSCFPLLCVQRFSPPPPYPTQPHDHEKFCSRTQLAFRHVGVEWEIASQLDLETDVSVQ